MKREDIVFVAYFLSFMGIMFGFTALDKGSAAQRFVVGIIAVQFILAAKDNVSILLRQLFFGGPSIFNFYNVKKNVADRVSIGFLIFMALSLGLFFWVVSWEGTTGVPFGVGAFLGAVLYELAVKPLCELRIKSL